MAQLGFLQAFSDAPARTISLITLPTLEFRYYQALLCYLPVPKQGQTCRRARVRQPEARVFAEQGPRIAVRIAARGASAVTRLLPALTEAGTHLY
jgi:hypothetical protein